MVSQVGMAESGAPRRARNRRGEGSKLREELVAAARQLLMTAERESDLSIRAVTRAARTAPQSFYLQFASLDELLFAVYAVEFGELREAMARAVSEVPDPAGRLLALCRAYCDYAEAYPGRYRLLMSVPGQQHEAWERQQMPGAPAFQLLLQTVAAALAAGNVSTDPYLAASNLWAWLHGVVTLRAARPAFRWPPLEDMLVSVVRQLLADPGPSLASRRRDSARADPPWQGLPRWLARYRAPGQIGGLAGACRCCVAGDSSVSRTLNLPAERLDDDGGLARAHGKGDLAQRAPAPADGHDRIRDGDNKAVPHLAKAGREGDGQVRVGVSAGMAG